MFSMMSSDGRTTSVDPLGEIFQEIEQNSITFLRKLQFNPIEEILKQSFGCTEQCPFCGAYCEKSINCSSQNRRHRSELHRPQV